MQKNAEETASRRSSIADLVKTRGARTALFAGLGVLAFQQLTGINAVIFYTNTIFKAAGSSLRPDIASIIVAFVQVCYNFKIKINKAEIFFPKFSISLLNL